MVINVQIGSFSLLVSCINVEPKNNNYLKNSITIESSFISHFIYLLCLVHVNILGRIERNKTSPNEFTYIFGGVSLYTIVKVLVNNFLISF